MPVLEQPEHPPQSQSQAEMSAAGARPWLRWYGTVPAQLAYPDATLYEALEAAAQRAPDAVGWDFMDREATYRDFLAMIGACANGLAALGVKSGDRILVAM